MFVKKIPINGSNQDILKWVWINLIPKSGQSEWVQGEVLRAIEKLRFEAQSNGNINWDDQFIMLTNYIENTLISEKKFNSALIQQIKSDLNRLKNFETPNIEDDLYDRLCEVLVLFCKENPDLIKNKINSRQYR